MPFTVSVKKCMFAVSFLVLPIKIVHFQTMHKKSIKLMQLKRLFISTIATLWILIQKSTLWIYNKDKVLSRLNKACRKCTLNSGLLVAFLF